MSILVFIVGLVLLVAGAELLVRSASRLARGFGLSPLLIGLTIVAFGTSTPEVAVSVGAALSNEPDLVTGNCVGSSIFNILLILGMCAAIAPLLLKQQLVWIDVPIMIAAHLLLFVLALDGVVSRWDGLLLLAGIIGYTAFAIRRNRRETSVVIDEYKKSYGDDQIVHNPASIPKSIGFIIVSLVLCVLGARWMVESAAAMARTLGVSELIIGLTIVAAGTSMPEVATSVVATFRGQRDIAIGNVVGSNIFNILGIIGISAIIAPKGINVAPAILRFDLPVAIAACVACLPIFLTGHKISRAEGLVFLAYYAAYTGWIILHAMEHDLVPVYSAVMLWFVVPLTAITLLILTWHGIKERMLHRKTAGSV